MLKMAPREWVDPETLPSSFTIEMDWPKEGEKKTVKVEWEMVEIRF